MAYDAIRRETFMRFYGPKKTTVFKRQSLDKLYDSGILDVLYDVNKSITQSLRARTGKVLEGLVQRALEAKRVSFGSQVVVSADAPHATLSRAKARTKNHRILDFVVPSPTTSLKNAIVISCKTSLRERLHQDSTLSCAKRVLVTYQKDVRKARASGFECLVLDRGKERMQLARGLTKVLKDTPKA